MNRRRWLSTCACLPLAAACSHTSRFDTRLPDTLCASPLPAATPGQEDRADVRLRVEPGRAALAGDDAAATAVWTYNTSVPGPIVRARQGELLGVRVDNALPVATTVHWHGLRLHNAMDGVPHLTQAPIAPAAHQLYRVLCRNAGTHWYHPHLASHEQLVRGLAGAFIVAEEQTVVVDHDLVWVLSDWLLDSQQRLRGDFDDLRDISHAGRMGNLVTINGRRAMFADTDPDPLPIERGARVRLRLVNASSARVFVPQFVAQESFALAVAALDGHPGELFVPEGLQWELAPAQRVDVFFDMPAGRLDIRDVREEKKSFLLRSLQATGQRQRRAPIAPLPPNPWLEPDLSAATTFDVLFEGGARGTLKEAVVGGVRMSAQKMANDFNLAWTLNGVSSREHDHAPLFSVPCGTSVRIRMDNRTQWQHPIHLHGHHFRVLRVNGRPPQRPQIRDTFMMEPASSAEIAFVADNPGDWMFHCHILQHQAGGMMGTIRVT